MQKLFTTIMLIAFIPVLGLAQITLDADNVTMEPNYADARVSVFSDPPIPIPDLGEDAVYDYSAAFSSLIDTTWYFPATDANFENSARFLVGGPNFGPISLASEYYEGRDASGLFRSGSYLRSHEESLVSFTGNPQDSIIFPGSYSIFDEPDYLLKFPTNYGDEWSNEGKFITETEVTASAFFLDGAPVVNEQSFSRSVEVVGWGELILPGADDTEVSFDVLLVRDELVYIDSFFLAGDPAPPQLLSAFNLTQGAVSFLHRYNFYGEGFSSPLIALSMDSEWETATFASFKSGLVMSNTDELARNTVSGRAFPNPSASGQNITFQVEESLESPVLTVIDNTGKVVFEGEPNRSSDREFNWSTAGDMSQGIYFYRLKDQATAKFSTGKLMIH